MVRGAQTDAKELKRKRIKWTSFVGLLLLVGGACSTLATWVLLKEVWLVSGIAFILGMFLMTHAWIARSTNMG